MRPGSPSIGQDQPLEALANRRKCWRLSNFDLRSFLPRRIAGQITLVVIAAVLIFNALMTGLALLRHRDHGPPPGPAVHRFESLARLLEALPPADRQRMATTMASAFPDLQIVFREPGEQALLGDAQILELPRRDRKLRFMSFDALAEGARAHQGHVSLRLADGAVVEGSLPAFPFAPAPAAGKGRTEAMRQEVVERDANATQDPPLFRRGPRPDGPPSIWGILVATSCLLAVNLILLSRWAARGLTAPLKRFAHAAEEFSLDSDPTPLAEVGPEEVRIASRALNRLQQRVKDLVKERTRMLAAIGHDLRTPITRLRLRAEFVEDEANRAEMLRDLGQMTRMIHSALSYFRYGQDPGRRTLVDLNSMLQTIRDQFADLGAAVSFEGPDHLLIRGHPDELLRAVTNLVENAAKFGTTTIMRARQAGADMVEIEVADDGPGIPEAAREAMLAPFVNGHRIAAHNGRMSPSQTGLGEASLGEASSAHPGLGQPSFGLGLTIARAVVEGHGGELSLLDSKPTGLTVLIRLPLAPRDPATQNMIRKSGDRFPDKIVLNQ